MKLYRIEVKEIHSDMVWVEAETPEEAESKAMELSCCEFIGVYDSKWTGESEDI